MHVGVQATFSIIRRSWISLYEGLHHAHLGEDKHSTHNTNIQQSTQTRLPVSDAFSVQKSMELYEIPFSWLNKVVGMNLGIQFFTTNHVHVTMDRTY